VTRQECILSIVRQECILSILTSSVKCGLSAQGKEKKTVADQHLSTEEEEAVHRLEKKCVHVSTSKVIETNVEKDHNL
jgi:hypothetical protein